MLLKILKHQINTILTKSIHKCQKFKNRLSNFLCGACSAVMKAANPGKVHGIKSDSFIKKQKKINLDTVYQMFIFDLMSDCWQLNDIRAQLYMCIHQ